MSIGPIVIWRVMLLLSRDLFDDDACFTWVFYTRVYTQFCMRLLAYITLLYYVLYHFICIPSLFTTYGAVR
jgi:hypothetical protein